MFSHKKLKTKGRLTNLTTFSTDYWFVKPQTGLHRLFYFVSIQDTYSVYLIQQ